VTEKSFDDFVAAGADQKKIRRILGLSEADVASARPARAGA
jgi:hypothetical protein